MSWIGTELYGSFSADHAGVPVARRDKPQINRVVVKHPSKAKRKSARVAPRRAAVSRARKPSGAPAVTRPRAVVILAAGQGTRMKSSLPKVLHQVAGVPMVQHVLAGGQALGATRTVVVVAPGMDSVAKAVRPATRKSVV